jgi:hypothetical protein
MTAVSHVTPAPEVANPAADRARTGDIKTRIAGFAAIAFVISVAVQNIVRGSSAPANDASGGEVLSYFADHRAITFVVAGSFVVNAAALATFLGATMRRLLAGSRPAWAVTGGVGAVGVVVLFAMVVASEQALYVVAGQDQASVAAVEALWALHNSAFSVLFAALAVALTGLALAGVGAGVTPKAFERIAPVGGALLAVGAIAGPAIAAGEAMPLFGLAGIGFLVWLAFLLTTGLRLVRS